MALYKFRIIAWKLKQLKFFIDAHHWMHCIYLHFSRKKIRNFGNDKPWKLQNSGIAITIGQSTTYRNNSVMHGYHEENIPISTGVRCARCTGFRFLHSIIDEMVRDCLFRDSSVMLHSISANDIHLISSEKWEGRCRGVLDRVYTWCAARCSTRFYATWRHLVLLRLEQVCGAAVSPTPALWAHDRRWSACWLKTFYLYFLFMCRWLFVLSLKFNLLRHETSRHDKHDMCESWLDVTCCVVSWRAVIFQHGGRQRSSIVLACKTISCFIIIFIISAHKWN